MSRTPNTRARDCSPTPEEMSALMNACNDPIERFIIAAAGVVGLDKGMIAHFKSTWVDHTKRHINIPSMQECTCYYCCDAPVEGSTQRGHGIQGRDGTRYWHPKGRTLKSGAFKTSRNRLPRRFGWHPWATEAIEKFTASYPEFPYQARAINDILDRIQARAGIQHRITVHGLRSFAASNFAHIFGGDRDKVNACMGWYPNSDMAKAYVEAFGIDEALKGRGLI